MPCLGMYAVLGHELLQTRRARPHHWFSQGCKMRLRFLAKLALYLTRPAQGKYHSCLDELFGPYTFCGVLSISTEEHMQVLRTSVEFQHFLVNRRIGLSADAASQSLNTLSSQPNPLAFHLEAGRFLAFLRAAISRRFRWRKAASYRPIDDDG